MADLTPELLNKLHDYARLWQDDELQGSGDIKPESPVGKVLAALPRLVAAARKLERITTAMEAWAKCADAEAANKPGSVGSFIAAEIRRRVKEAINE